MPASPALADQLAEPLLRLYLAAEMELLRKVARRTERGLSSPSWADQKLLEVQYLRREAESTLRGVVGVGRQTVEEAVRMAYNRGVAAAGSDLTRAENHKPLGFGWFKTSESTVANLVLETVSRVQAMHWPILRTVTDAYREVIAEATGHVIIGDLTRREAAQRALNHWYGRGITGFTDRTGRGWDLASYAEMAVRTGAGNAAVLGHTDRLQTAGEDLVIVSGSGRPCPRCAPWQGRILSVSGSSHDYPSLDEARGAGLFHPNCRHSTGLYVEGLTRPLNVKVDPHAYDDTQRQREMERTVREWKRREALAITPEQAQKAKLKVREWQGRIRQHVASTGLPRLYYREGIKSAR